MSALAILGELQGRGVSVTADGDTLVLKPRRALDSDLLARVREYKPEILHALSARPATCAPSCYVVDEETGAMIHHPWAGCTTIKLEADTWRRVSVVCWHCAGIKLCDCSACWTGGPGECVTCNGTGQVLRWVQ